MLKSFIKRYRNKEAVYTLYSKIVEQARKPSFYLGYGVDDTLDGRFEMVLLHLSLIIMRLENEGDVEEQLQRQLQEAFVTDMDRSLREMGVGDMSVGKQVKKMSVAWFGRSKAYRDSIMADDENVSLQETIIRNVYSGKVGKASTELAAYVRLSYENIQSQEVESLKEKPTFAELSYKGKDDE